MPIAGDATSRSSAVSSRATSNLRAFFERLVSVDEICALSIEQLAHAYRSGAASPVEATHEALARIERIDKRVNSFITVTLEVALQQAGQAQEALAHGKDQSPLLGVPIALKDLYATKGIRTTAHSRVLLDWIPDHDAACTTRLRAAGAVLLGKLAMHEFAWGPPPGFDTPFPPARNPWDVSRAPGGSSSGSGAALAGRLCLEPWALTLVARSGAPRMCAASQA